MQSLSYPCKKLFDAILDAAIKTNFKTEFSRDENTCAVTFKKFNPEKMDWDLYERYSYCQGIGYRVFFTHDVPAVEMEQTEWICKVSKRFEEYGVKLRLEA